MVPSGRGKRRVLIVGEAPGKEEDRKGKPFVGPSGQQLRNALDEIDIDLERDCWITNALICHPPNNKIDDVRKIDYCRPNLISTIKRLQPEKIILLGNSANTSLLTWLWKEDPDTISKWAGWRIPEQTLNAWICPTWHPRYVYSSDYGTSGKVNPVRIMIWKHHLAQAFELKGRPWKEVPDYEAQVKQVFDTDKAASIIRYFIKEGGLAAFDYETNRLKPDNPNAKIICASICWRGEHTIAFPWQGKVIAAMRDFLHSPTVEKVAANLKFEDRWTRAVFGKPVKNWKWCTMTAAHVIDNRPGITGLKFQAFVMLGAQSYDDHIKPLLHSKSKEVKVNQILSEINIDQLLLYCGLDSLLEYHLALKQMEYLKCDR
jgi:uracil-DNA glycosylase family 4